MISGLLGKYVDYQSLSPKYCKINTTPLAGIKAYKRKYPWKVRNVEIISKLKCKIIRNLFFPIEKERLRTIRKERSTYHYGQIKRDKRVQKAKKRNLENKLLFCYVMLCYVFTIARH